MRYFLKIAYNGSSFHGWQIQPNAVSVQETLEKNLSLILRQNINITGAGRTDSGVHAREMYAHFDFNKEIENKDKFLLSLNRLSGKYIAIYDLIRVNENSHARFDALERTYKYFVGFNKNPFLGDYYWHSPSQLDLNNMNEAANCLLQTVDFTSFAKLHSDSKTNICKVNKALWKNLDEDPEALEFIGDIDNGIVFTISADRFLRNMVRAIVGTLVEIGRGKLTLTEFKDIIKKRNRCDAGSSMPAHALFLWNIKYAFL